MLSRYYDAITRSYRQYSKTYSAGSIKLTRPNVISLRELELHAAVEDLQVYRVSQQFESTRDASAKQAISRNAPTTEGGTPESI